MGATVVFGLLGDRFSRRKLIIIDLIVESLALILSSGPGQVPESGSDSGPETQRSWQFFAIGRFLLGIFQACYNSLTPTIVADMFEKESKRTKMMGIYASSVLLGIALGFVVSPVIANFGGYKAVFYFGAGLDLILAGFFMLMPEYERGQGERRTERADDFVSNQQKYRRNFKSVKNDILYLLSTKTYLIITLAFAAVTGLTETGLTFLNELVRRQFVLWEEETACRSDFYFEPKPDNNSNLTFVNFTCQLPDCQIKCTSDKVSILIASCGLFGGMGGTIIGNLLYNHFYKNSTKKSGSLIGTIGCFLSAITVIFYKFFVFSMGVYASWTLCFLVFFFSAMPFGVVLDVCNRVILPEKRSFANSLLNLIGGGLGGTIPPYITGLIIERKALEFLDTRILDKVSEVSEIPTVQHSYNTNKVAIFQSLRVEAAMSGMMVIAYCAFIGAVAWWISGLFWASDERKKDSDLGLKVDYESHFETQSLKIKK